MSSDLVSSFLQRPEWFEAFTKQELEGKWKPIPNFYWTLGFFLVLTIIVLPLGGSLYYCSKLNRNYSVRYDTLDTSDTSSKTELLEKLYEGKWDFNLTVTVNKKMKSPPVTLRILIREVRDLILICLVFNVLVFFSMRDTNSITRPEALVRVEQTDTKNGTKKKSLLASWFLLFIRQELPSLWNPKPTVLFSVGFFFVLTLIAVPLAAILLRQSLKNTEVIFRYDSFNLPGQEQLNNTQRKVKLQNSKDGIHLKNITMRIPEKLESPVYVYYELKDYYQNHKRYVRSLNDDQMGGKDIKLRTLASCRPFRTVPLTVNKGSEKNPSEGVINPCGLIAHSFFNDTFILKSAHNERNGLLDLHMTEEGIATKWDRKYLYGDHDAKNFNNDNATRGGNTIEGPLNENEHFMVWMKVGSRPTVRKLYGIIKGDIPEGSVLTFEIKNRYNTYGFGGEKKLILSTANWTGGRNIFLGVVFFVVGGLSAIACIVILVYDTQKTRMMGDLRALSWNKKDV